jgi:hypothetical protein
VKINDRYRGSIVNTNLKLKSSFGTYHIYKGLNFLDIRNEENKQENVILNLRTMKQQHYWNNELYKYMEMCREGDIMLMEK